MKKKSLIIIILFILGLGVGLGVYLFLNHQDENTLTILEKQWIDDNKNSRIDISVQSSIPIFSYDGEGVLFDYLTDLEETTGLEFNEIPYSSNAEYSFLATDELNQNDIVLFNDNYAIVTKEKVKYSNLYNCNINVGVLNTELESIKKYLGDNVTYTTYETIDELFQKITEENNTLDGIVIPKTLYLDRILENSLNIAYNISEMTKYYVIRLGSIDRLNDILTKYYQKWQSENYTTSFSSSFLNTYYEFTNFEDDDKVKFKSKRYKYGFVSYAPYDALIEGSLVGVNSEVIKDFSKVGNIEVTFTEYKSLSDLVNAFNKNEIDFFFNTTSNKKYELDVKETVSITDEKIAILSSIDNNIIINSLNSITDVVKTISNTKIDALLKSNKIETKKYKNLNKLVSSLNKNSVIAIDYDTYNIYKNSYFKDYKIDYVFNLNSDYVYTIRDIKDNKLFGDFFNFYLSFINDKTYANKVNYKTFETANKIAFVKPLLFIIFAVLGLLFITLIIKKIKNGTKKPSGITKENKLRYIDMLTSLKNRNYLNDSIEKWDESEIYPQSIIIIDLNNIAYINDNYGHNEGDNVITEAANILIKNQLEQSEIIRTNGNEFLIYLVGYEEKQILTYIRRLSKEFKELEHGFGAAVGYSMINDALKTVDDAINEATLDMKNNKEEAE